MNIRGPLVRLATSLALAAACTSPAQSSPLIAFEDFESVLVRDASLPFLDTAVGLFTPGLAGLNVFVSSPGYTNYGPGLNPTTSSVLTANGDENFIWALAFPAQTVQLQIYLNDLGPATMAFYDAADGLLAAFNFEADSDTGNNLVTLNFDAGADIVARATFVSTRGGILNTGLDNITIAQGGGTVPEPAGMALLATALGLALAAGRRRRP